MIQCIFCFKCSAPAQEPPIAPAAQMPKQVVPPAQQAPQLVEPLRDVHVNEGEQVSFQCTIVAHPGKVPYILLLTLLLLILIVLIKLMMMMILIIIIILLVMFVSTPTIFVCH